MKKLIIAASDGYTHYQLQYFVNSILMLNDKNIDIVIVTFNMDHQTRSKLLAKGVKIYAIGQSNEIGDMYYRFNHPVHVERFYYINQYLCEYGEQYDYIITTDIKDVIFQKNPFNDLEELLDFRNDWLLVGSEGLLYKNEAWGYGNIHDTYPDIPGIFTKLREKEIYNVGVIAGYMNYVRDLCLNIYLMAIGRPIKICDQAVFNQLLDTEPLASVVCFANPDDGFVVHMGTTNDPSKEAIFDPLLLCEKPKFVDGLMVNNEGFVYSIVHQYDRNPIVKQIFLDKYGDKN